MDFNFDFSLKRAQDCLKFATILQVNRDNAKTQREALVESVEEAKKWLEKQPDFLTFLQQLQNILHQKNIGAFSQLLSYFVKDVLKKDKDIIFELYTYHNLPALKIEASNDGCRESIIDGNGGSIANIVSTGLRLIALSRMTNRKFIVLDEPDCWLENNHIPAFAKIIGEISEKLKIQTIMISHHKWEYFKDYGRVIELKSDGKNLYTEIINDVEKSIPENLDYIKTIEIRNFMSHYHTRYELSPYLNCLIGTNDIGKSVLGTALKAVAYNDSSDSYIKHFTTEAQVLIETSLDKKVFWQRFKEISTENTQKVKYSLFEKDAEGNEKVTSEYESSYVPGFIQDVLNVVTVEDIDVHIGNQKQPVFLLSSDIKPQQKAKILSLGKESLFVQKMMENIKTKTRNNKKILKDAEKTFTTLDTSLKVLSDVDELHQKINQLIEDLVDLKDHNGNIVTLENEIKQLKNIDELASLEKIKTDFPNVRLKDTDFLESTLNQYIAVSAIAEIEALNFSEVKIPKLKDVSNVLSDLKKIKLLNKACEIGTIDIKFIKPTLKNTEELKSLILEYYNIEKLNSVQKIDVDYNLFKLKLKDLNEIKNDLTQLKKMYLEFENLEKEKNALKVMEKAIEKEKEQYKIEHGEICPLCNQKIDFENLISHKN